MTFFSSVELAPHRPPSPPSTHTQVFTFYGDIPYTYGDIWWGIHTHTHTHTTHTHTHTPHTHHTHSCWFLWFTGTFHRCNGFYTVQAVCYCPTPTLHLNLALTGDCAFLFFLKKTHSVWFISVLNYGDTENVLINHLLLVIPMLYPCHYTNLCPHKPHKHAHTHNTRTHMIYMKENGVECCFGPLWFSLYGQIVI